MMKQQYKYIEMVDVTDDGRETKKFVVMNRRYGIGLGEISWYAPWRQYVFIPSMDTVFSAGCLEDIVNFVSALEQGRKMKGEA